MIFFISREIFKRGYSIVEFPGIMKRCILFTCIFLFIAKHRPFSVEKSEAYFARFHLATRERGGRVSHPRQHFIWLQNETRNADERENKVFPISIKFLGGALLASQKGCRPRSYMRTLVGSNLRWLRYKLAMCEI